MILQFVMLMCTAGHAFYELSLVHTSVKQLAPHERTTDLNAPIKAEMHFTGVCRDSLQLWELLNVPQAPAPIQLQSVPQRHWSQQKEQGQHST